MELIRKKFKEVLEINNVKDLPISIKANAGSPTQIQTRTLSPQEAIGTPKHNDYPIVIGKEKMMEASFEGSRGVAFTDFYGHYDGTLNSVVELPLEDNFQRAVFVATINGVLNHLGLIEKTGHCKNDEMLDCAGQLNDWIRTNYGNPSIFQVGLQPRMVEALSKDFKLKVSDRDENNFSKKIGNVIVSSPENGKKLIEESDIIFATGSIFTNNTFREFYNQKIPLVIYGVTGAGIAYLLDLPRYCPCGHDV